MLVSLTAAKERLRFDQDSEDDTLTLLIQGASAAVLNYLKVDHDTYNDSSGEVPFNSDGTTDAVPYEVQNAVLLLVGILSRDRDGTEMKDWEQGYLPRPVIALLYPLRDPALS